MRKTRTRGSSRRGPDARWLTMAPGSILARADRGAPTIAQDEESCVVFGMPAEAIKLGAARFVFPPHRIAELLTTVVRRGASKGGIDGNDGK